MIVLQMGAGLDLKITGSRCYALYLLQIAQLWGFASKYAIVFEAFLLEFHHFVLIM